MLSIRKIGVFGRTYRHLNRYRQILTVLFKHGFGDLIDSLKIDEYLEVGLQMLSRKTRNRSEKHTRAERLRMALEELGSTYIKLGQALSTRPDLIPADFVHELTKLQDHVPPYPFAEARAIIEHDLGDTLAALFQEFEETPLASGSIGQVYRARLPDGEPVAVKVQRPRIHRTIEVDLEIMLHLATLMERHIEEIALHRPVKIVEEFARTLEKETDYNIEAANMEQFAQRFLDDPTLYVPKVFRDLTTTRVLTAEFIEGIKVSEVDRLEAAGLDRHIITARGADLILKQVFEHGFFHADPHPGNIFILPDNVICLLDFGMAGAVDRQIREDFVELVDGVVRRDQSRAAAVLLKITTWDQEPDLRQLEREVSDFMGKHLYRPLKEIQIARLFHDLLLLASRNHLRMPPDIFLMLKALSTVEGVALMLDPDFDMIKRAEPYIKRVLAARFTPPRVLGEILKTSSELLKFVQQFPQDLLEITRLVRQQRLSVNIEHQGLKPLMATHDQVSNRISFAIIIAALIIGSALIVRSGTPPFIFGFSMIGIIGFLAAAVMGVWLLVAILRKGRL